MFTLSITPSFCRLNHVINMHAVWILAILQFFAMYKECHLQILDSSLKINFRDILNGLKNRYIL